MRIADWVAPRARAASVPAPGLLIALIAFIALGLLSLSPSFFFPCAAASPGSIVSSGSPPGLRHPGYLELQRPELPTSAHRSPVRPAAPPDGLRRTDFPHLLTVPASGSGIVWHRLQRGPSAPRATIWGEGGNAAWQPGGPLPPSILSRDRLERAGRLLAAATSAERATLLRRAENAFAEPETVRILALRVDFLQDTPGSKTTGDGRFDLRRDEQSRSILIDPPPHDRRYIEAHMEALSRYYRSQTRGALVLQWDVYPAENDSAYHLPDTFRYGPWWFSNSNPDIYQHAIDFVGDALAVADSTDPSIDFTRYLRGPRRDISILIFHAGPDLQSDINSDSPWDIPSFNLGVAVPFMVQDSVAVNLAMVVPETVTQDGFTGALNGVLAHEFGHQLGFYDLYEVSTGLSMVGAFSLMDSGNDLGAVLPDSTQPDSLLYVHGALPASLDPWHKYLFFGETIDWVQPEDSLLADARAFTTSLSAVETSNRLLYVPLNVTEELLLENRHWDLNGDGETPVLKRDEESGVILGPAPLDSLAPSTDAGYDEYDHLLPGQGVVLWHIDWRAIVAGWSLPFGGTNSFYDRLGVGVVEADGIRDIGASSAEYLGGPLDPFFRGGYDCLTPAGEPSSATNDGTPTGYTVCALDSIAVNMRVRVRSDRYPGRSQVSIPGEPGEGQVLSLDLDGDGNQELVVASQDVLRVLDFEGEELRELPTGRVSGSLAGRSDFRFGGSAGDTRPLVAAVSDGYLVLPDLDPMFRWPSADSTQVADSLVSSSPVLLPDAILVGCRDGIIRAFQPDGGTLPALRLLARFPVTDGTISLVGARPEETGGAVVFWASEDGAMGRFLWRGQAAEQAASWERTASAPLGRRPVTLLTAPLGTVDRSGEAGYFSLWRDGSLEWRDADGQLLPGWPVSLGAAPAGEAVLCDADGDGVLETMAADANGVLHSYGWTGVERLHYPRRIWSEDDEDPPAQLTGPRALDVTGDGVPELLILRGDGTLLALDGRGAQVDSLAFSSGSLGSSGPHWVPAGTDHGPRLCVGSVDYFRDLSTTLLWLRLPGASGEGAGYFPVVGVDQARSRAYPLEWVPHPSVPELAFDEASLRLYPNPLRRDRLTVSFLLGRSAQVTLEAFDLTGQRVARMTAPGTPGSGGNQLEWDLGRLAPGLYHVRFRVAGDGFSRELLKKVAVVR